MALSDMVPAKKLAGVLIEKGDEKMGQRKKKKKPRWEREIALSRWVMFRAKDEELMMKLFKLSLEHHIKEAKKSHWIMLECRWKNMGCKPKYDKKNDKYIGQMIRG